MNQFLAVINQNASGENLLNICDMVIANGGKIKQIWDGEALLGEGSPELHSQLNNSPVLSLFNAMQQPTLNSLGVNENTMDVIQSWILGKTPDFQQAWEDLWNANVSQTHVLPEDNCSGGTNLPSDQISMPLSRQGPLGIIGNQQLITSIVNKQRRSLVGTIGITILKIDGPAGSSAVFSIEEWTQALLSLSKGLDILQTLAPISAHLVFTTSIRKTVINLDPNSIPFPIDPRKPTNSEYEQIESMWRNPALANFGASQNMDGYQNLVFTSNFPFSIDWGFVLVLTKYRAAYPGYASHFNNIIMSYGMEPDLSILPSIFAHEIGHLTGALDEYSPNCSPFHICGFTKTPNFNCDAANPFSVDCLMKNLKPVVCPSTKNHFGWGDQNNDGIIDPYDPYFISI